MSFRIYTKTGDKGETSLFGGKRLPKNHIRIESYGTVDELNSWIGLVRDGCDNEEVRAALLQVQERLFTIGANLASDPEKKMSTPDLLESDIAFLEQEMDRMEESLEPLRNFILPGGHPLVSHCHIARCVCRRAERLVVALDAEEPVLPLIVQYLNRLSDYFFMLARFMAFEKGVDEIKWEPRKKEP